MIPSQESPDEEDGKVDFRGPSIEELRDMKVVTRMKRRVEKKGAESRVAVSSRYGCTGAGGCGKGGGQQDEKWVQLVGVDEEARKMRLSFQVAAVSKPQLAMKRIAEKRSHVVFGPGDEGNFILNRKVGDKLMLRPNGRGSYSMKVEIVG
eukprot:5692550-Karenia_brevis.AAC.1